MGDVARCSIAEASDYYNEDLLYRMFGRNAELLIDHAWGWEPCTIADIQSYEPDAHSISSGQVLTGPADYATARLITKEMADALALDLVDKSVLTNRLTLAVGYDIGSLDSTKLDSCADSAMKRASDQTGKSYRGPVSVDRYGRRVPTGHRVDRTGEFTSSSTRIREAMTMLYERIVDPRLLVRRLTVIADDVATANELAVPANATSSLICFPGSIRPRRRGTMAMSAFQTVMCGVSMTCRLHCWRSRGNSPQCRHQGDGHGGRRHRPGPQSADRRPSCVSVSNVLRYRA